MVTEQNHKNWTDVEDSTLLSKITPLVSRWEKTNEQIVVSLHSSHIQFQAILTEDPNTAVLHHVD
jgi:hypothetical protein